VREVLLLLQDKGRARGELTQRLTYILLYCSVQPQHVTDLTRRVGGGHSEIRSAIEHLTQRLFLEKSQNDGEVFNTTPPGWQWAETQIKQYYSMFGLPYIKEPPGLSGEEVARKLGMIVPFKKRQSLFMAITLEMMEGA